MSTSNGQFAKGLAKIWRSHQEIIQQRVATIAEAVHLLTLNQLPAEMRQRAGEDAHKLAGNLGTFGHPTASDHARSLELRLLASEPLVPGDGQQLIVHVKSLQAAIQEISAAMEKPDTAVAAATTGESGGPK